MDPAQVIDRCDAIAALSSKMLDAARAGNWAEVERLRGCASEEIDAVRRHGAKTVLSREQRSAKYQHLERIIVNAGRIQELAEPGIRSFDRWWARGANDPYRDIPK